jgi:hypothetical protein
VIVGAVRIEPEEQGLIARIKSVSSTRSRSAVHAVRNKTRLIKVDDGMSVVVNHNGAAEARSTGSAIRSGGDTRSTCCCIIVKVARAEGDGPGGIDVDGSTIAIAAEVAVVNRVAPTAKAQCLIIGEIHLSRGEI